MVRPLSFHCMKDNSLKSIRTKPRFMTLLMRLSVNNGSDIESIVHSFFILNSYHELLAARLLPKTDILLNGPGKLILSNGDIEEGYFVNSLLHGQGKRIEASKHR